MMCHGHKLSPHNVIMNYNFRVVVGFMYNSLVRFMGIPLSLFSFAVRSIPII